MTTIRIKSAAGVFAENKDIAREIRSHKLIPALENGQDVTIDFSGVEGATQSFIHALISEVMRRFDAEILDRITFKNCSSTVQKIITIVTDYMQESD